MKLVLASQSPRRRQLLTEHGYEFDVHLPAESAEDGRRGNESTSEYVCRLAYQKGASVAFQIERGLVIACDTVAECHGEILGKPKDRADAQRMLRLLRGNVHRVFSGLCLWERPSDRHKIEVTVTELVMDNVSDWQLDEYVDSLAWEGKAGAFGYQDGLDWLHILHGSESNVVGLPMELFAQMLAGFGPG